MDIRKLNQQAWDIQSQQGTSPWVQPVSAELIAQARQGNWQVILTPTINVPAAWFGHDFPLSKSTAQSQQRGGNIKRPINILALASGGGQQVPILAAAVAASGGHVTSFDNSQQQLNKDKQVAEQNQLPVTCVQGDMIDLSQFPNESFDLIFHPVSNLFSEQIRPVWYECHRVLKPQGRLLAGFMNPDYYLFDHQAIEQGKPPIAQFSLPFCTPDYASTQTIDNSVQQGEAIEFSHSLTDQIGGQLEAGFYIAGFYEDRWHDGGTPLYQYFPTSMATLAIKGFPD